jgi:hypothetical protein
MLFTWLWTVSGLIPNSSANSPVASPEQSSQDLGLTGRETPERELGHARGLSARSKLVEHDGELVVGHHDLARGRPPHHIHQGVGGTRLGHVAAGARGHWRR